jgi:uncharacterized protein (DUF1501 family)
MYLKRKEFLRIGSLATASFMVPKFLKAFEGPYRVPPGNKVLVILQLSGGNDGLNTVIPVRNDIYYKSRPRLGITKDKALLLTDEVGLNPALSSLKSLYDDGSLGILNNVGYPNPDRSHFRSMDIWHSASNSNEYVNSGWIGRYLDAQCAGCDKPTHRLINTSNEKYFKDVAAAHHAAGEEQPVDYLYKTMSETLSSADYIYKQSKLHPTGMEYPNSETGKSLKTIASLIFSDINTKVYYLSLGSFDTHVAQDGQQKRLFTEMNAAINAFVKDLKANNRFQDVLMMTFSEFGRRVQQNASGGTDHGTANNMFFISGGLKQQGILNPLPNLTDLQDGDLKHTVDFKNVYATVLNKWLSADDKKILGKQLDYLSFV